MNANTLLATAALAALAACSDAGVTAAPVPDGPAADRRAASRVASVHMARSAGIDGSYIVVLKEGADARGVAATVGARPRHVYGTALNGFAGELNHGQLEALRHNPRVDYIEQEQVQAVSGVQWPAPWNLDRIDQGRLPLNNHYSYGSVGRGVYAYVIDTGIYTGHANFTGRASVAFSTVPATGGDCNGHGTHVAGILGSVTYGVAKGVNLVGVRVMNCEGSGSSGDIISGIDWVATNHASPAVANLSLGGDYSQAENDAVTRLVDSGVFVAVAAGNEGTSACGRSPASAPAVTTVAASTSLDERADDSNYGSCVDLYAPGTSITSTWLSNFTKSMSGTSMASPHVAGVAALYKATYGDAPQSTIDAWLKQKASAGVVVFNPSGTPNLLLRKDPSL